MIRISQLKLSPNHTEEELIDKIAKFLRISEQEILKYEIRKQSLDARKKPDLFYVYTVDVQIANEGVIIKKCKSNAVSIVKEKSYHFQISGKQSMSHRPIIIGCGPAGMFCAYMLAKYGYRPIILERGACVEDRTKDVEDFWQNGVLKNNSNVQFGEGGAGTFSDGKLNTMVKDPFGRNRKVLEIFVENGAPKDILYINKPHIGTDILRKVVRNMREQIIAWGGEIHFHTQLIDFALKNERLSTITVTQNNHTQILDAQTMVLAIGHSARDTFAMLYEKNLPLCAKSFAVGVRIEHKQQMINESQYGPAKDLSLPAASYKVTAQTTNGRGVYSFCMCPGGYIVNASSEDGHLAVNGMSYHSRAGENANSAIIVTVTPEDFADEHPLAGMFFQRELEKKAFQLGSGKIPIQRFADFCSDRATTSLGSITPQTKGQYMLTNVRKIFPKEIAQSIEEGIKSFDRQIHGFANGDTLLAGVESRTSSPIRITRNKHAEIGNTGIYPCGEGAGYAGGITSAAIDGIKTAEMIAQKFKPFDAQ